jgi:hypothetical protein
MKKSKSLETKLRSAIRLIWSRSAERRAIIKRDMQNDPEQGKFFNCPLCHRDYPDWAGEVDHIEAIGPLDSWKNTVQFIDKMFFSPQRCICKTCHRLKTKEDRKAMRKK